MGAWEQWSVGAMEHGEKSVVAAKLGFRSGEGRDSGFYILSRALCSFSQAPKLPLSPSCRCGRPHQVRECSDKVRPRIKRRCPLIDGETQLHGDLPVLDIQFVQRFDMI